MPMIIVPTPYCKELVLAHHPNTPILLLDDYCKQLLNQTQWQIATPPMISALLSQWVDHAHIAPLKQHINALLSQAVDLDTLASCSHPNTQWLINIYQQLQKSLKKHHLIIPEAIYEHLTNTPHISPDYQNIQHYGFCAPTKALTTFFAHYNIQKLSHQTPSPCINITTYQRPDTEAQSAINWLVEQKNAAIVVLDNSLYSTALSRHYALHTTHINQPATEHAFIKYLIALTDPTPSIPIDIVPYLQQNNILPQGLSLYHFLSQNEHSIHTTINLDLIFMHTCRHQQKSHENIDAQTFVDIVESIFNYWQITHNTTSPLDQHVQKTLVAIQSLDLLPLNKNYTQWHSLFSHILTTGNICQYDHPILTPSQAQGASFDQIWIIGAHHDNWQQHNALPWLPSEYQTTNDFQFLMSTGQTIHLSYQEMHPSGHPNNAPGHLQTTIQKHHTPLSPSLLTHYTDWHTHAQKISGGVGLIQDYAACPFKAFARHNLKLKRKQQISHDIPPQHYGTLTHRVLESIYQDISHQEDLSTITDQDIESQIHKHWRTLPQIADLHPQLCDILQQKLSHTIRQWITCDQKRPEFSVHTLESKHTLQLDTHSIDIRIDRIDTADNQPILIDYKTGLANITDVLYKDMRAPQMAIYSLTQSAIPQIAYAKLKMNKTQWQSLDLGCTKTLSTHQKKHNNDPTFAQLKDLWTQQLQGCLDGYTSGDYTARPLYEQVCDTCDFASLCRFHDKTVYAHDPH